MSLIEVKNLIKTYSGASPVIAIKNLAFQIHKGEFVAIMGPSGSGKSTLLHILGLLDKPTSGEYFLAGKKIDNYSDNILAKLRNKHMGFIFQSFNLLAKTSVIDNVRLPLMY